MNVIQFASVALLLVVGTAAQAAPAQKPRADQVEYDKLIADWQAANQVFVQQLNGKQNGVSVPDGKAFGARAIALADQFAGEAAMPFLCFAVANCVDEEATKAVVARVLQNHVKSPGLATILKNAKALLRFAGTEDVEKLVEAVIADSPHALPRAWAMHLKATRLLNDKEAAARLLADAQPLAAGTLLAETLDADKLLADRTAAPTFEKENLQLGMTAPDIVGEDVDGVAFKLSDYRGKVVVLDYWGFW